MENTLYIKENGNIVLSYKPISFWEYKYRLWIPQFSIFIICFYFSNYKVSIPIAFLFTLANFFFYYYYQFERHDLLAKRQIILNALNKTINDDIISQGERVQSIETYYTERGYIKGCLSVILTDGNALIYNTRILKEGGSYVMIEIYTQYEKRIL